MQAHEQLRAVLLTLLEELPSDLPILLLGTSSVALAEVEEVPSSVFPHRSVYASSNLQKIIDLSSKAKFHFLDDHSGCLQIFCSKWVALWVGIGNSVCSGMEWGLP